MGEVASLLKTMRTTSTTPRVLAVVTDSNQGVLLDSGATHILRGPYDETEWMQAIPTEVQTATGKTQLRMSKMSRSLLTKDDLQPIVPLGMLTQHGCKMRWHRDGCALTHGKLGEVKVTVRDNCPYVTNDVGMKLIRELETAEKNKQLMLRSLEVTGWKQEDKDMADKLKKLFPETPVELLQPMVSKAGDEARLPWNRHQRRRFKKAKGIVLNLFSGPDQAWWSKRMPHDIEVVNVDLLRGQDLLDSAVWHFLLQFVRSGRVVAVLAGPPCRTVSAARYRSDGGPRPVRARHGLQRFGLDTNTMMEQQLADTDSQLWLRTLLLMYEAKLYNPDVKAVVETPEDPMTYRQDEVEYASFTVWPEVKSVLEKAVGLKRLTVDQGALGHQRRKPTCLWSNMEVIKALDGLKDDTKYAAWPDSLSRAMELSKSTAAWAPTLKDLMIREIHAIPLPQLRALNLTEEESWYLHLMSDHIPYRKDCLQCQVGAGRDRPRRRQKFQSTYEMSVDLAGPFERAPDQGRAKARYFMVATVKVPWLAEIGALVEGWKPKPRPEGFPDLEALLPEVTLDPDPFKEVEDVIRGPGRPKKVEEKYDVQASDPSKGGAPDSSKGGAQVEVVEVPQNGVQRGDVHVQDCRDGGAQDDELVKQLESCPLPEVPLQVLEKNPPEVDVNAEDVAKQAFQNKMAELQDVNVKPITFAVPVSDRRETTIINAVASLYTRFRALQVPIYRVRVDRAKELVSQRFRTWASARNLEVRVSPGDEPTQNSTAEIEIQILKNVTRTLLQSSGLDVSFWPLALRQAAEQRCRRQLSVLGLQLPALLPFGVWGVVRKKTWANRGVPLKYPKQRVRILGPSADMSPTSGGYWVVDERGNGFRTTVVSVPTKSAEMGNLQDLNPGQAPLPDDGQQPDGEQLHEQLPESPGYEPSILEDDAPGPGEDLEFEDMQRLVDGTMEVELQEMEEHATDLPWPLPPLPQPPRRVRGKQPPAVRGLMSSAYQQCNGCGLQQPRLSKCHFCNEPAVPAGGEWTEMDDDEVQDQQDQQDGQAQDEDVHQLQQLCKDEMAVNHLVKGMCDLWNEERYMLAQAEGDQDVNELAKYANSIHSQLMMLQNQQQQLTKEIDKMVLGEEEKVLQTYTVAAKEVRAEADKWKPAIKEEIDNLLSTNTIIKMSKEEVASLESSGMALEKIPGKLVATRKAPLGRRRARIVACGNFVHGDPLDADSDVAAGGVDGIAIRLLVKLAAEREWCLKSIDVKAAFLQAPKRSVKTRTTLVQPPRLLVELGLAQQGEWWSVQGALYGLVESPKDWSVHRDQELPLLRWSVDGVQYKLVQTEELHLWMVTPVEMTSSWKPGSQGFLATYVDDFLVGAPQEQANAMLEAVQRRWTCSPPEMVTEDHQMKFCGYEIAKVKDGFFLHQCGYLKDVLKRHGMEAGMAPVKNLFANLGEDDTEEVQTGDLRQAQQVIGELQWLVTRTRPDMVYHVGVMARLAHRRARHVVKLGDELLRYLSATSSKGLHYMKTSAQKPYGRNDELATQVSINNLEVFVDASHALEHENYKSVTGVILCVGGSPIAWASGRQPFVTTSTAESELVSCGEGFQCGESLAALLEVMGVGDINKTLNCDSKSALHLCTNDTGSWRTRHLRIRYARLREAFQDELSRWCARHVSGLVLPADGATKPLQGPKMDNFVDSIYLDDLNDLRRAEDELRAEEEIVVRLLSTGQTLMETDDSQCQETGLGLIVAACWMMKKRERENEPSPPWSVRENEPTDMEEANVRAPNEPALRHEGREDEPPRRLMKTMVRAPNEPTMQEEGRENEPPNKSQKEAMQPFPKGMIDVEGKRNFRVSNMERSLSAEYYPQRDQVSSPQRSSQNLDNCPSGCHGPQLRALKVSHGKRRQQQGLSKRRQGDGHGFNCNLVGRAEQWHGLEGDPIEDFSVEDLGLEPPTEVLGAGRHAMESTARSSGSSATGTSSLPASRATKGKGHNGQDDGQHGYGKGQGGHYKGQQGQMDGQPDQKGKGTGKVSERGRVAMLSPTTSAIWAGTEPQPLGPVQQRGQAAMGARTMRGSRFGFEYVPIRNYHPRLQEPEPQERPPRPLAQQVNDTQSDGSYELVSEAVDEEQPPQTERQVQLEGKHGAMAMPPPGGDGDDPGRDRRNRREPERDHGPDPPADDEDEDEEESPRRTCATLDVKRQRMAWARPPGYWFRGRGRGTKQDVETGKDGSTIIHGALSPNLSWQRIFAKGCRPRQLFTHDQRGKGSAQAAPVLMGRGDTPAEQRRSILLATANAKAVQALRTADQVNVTSEDSNEVALAVEAATAAVDYAADVQEMTESGTTPGQAGSSSSTSRTSVARLGQGKPATNHELQAHYAAKGNAKGSEALESFADGLHEDGGETAEEEASENDMEVIPEEDEGDDGDDGGGDDGGAEEPATDPPAATTATEVAITSTTAGDPANVEEEVNAEPENVEEEVNVEQDTEVGNARPSRVVRNDPEHEMAPMVPGSLGQQMRAKASFGMAPAPPAQHVQQVMTALMQGQTIPLTYGRWVQWDQTSWVGSMQTYRYGVLNGLQVEMDFAQVGLMLRRPVVPGVTHSLALQGNVVAVPKNGLTRESTEEEADPGVPFEHGMVQPGKKPPPQAWFQQQNMQEWMNRMAKPPAVPAQHAMPGPPPAGPPPQVRAGPPPMGPPPAKAMARAAPNYVPGPLQGQPPMAAPMQQRPQGPAGYGGDQGGSLQPPQQQMMGNPGQRATLSHMLRMTGELRAERGVQPAKAAADLGLRPVLRPPMTTSKAAASSTNVYVERREEAADRVTVRSDSPALSVTSSSTA